LQRNQVVLKIKAALSTSVIQTRPSP
jgi:hypothetical protein